MRILDQLTRHFKTVIQPHSPVIWIDLFGKQACAPHDLPATLRRIDAFAEHEKCHITLVLVRSNNERNEPRVQTRHVTVLSVDSPEKRTEIFLQECRKIARAGGVIITGDAVLEKKLCPTGVPLMRFSTFEKALALPAPKSSPTPVHGSADRRPPEPRGRRPHPPQRSSRTTPPALAQKNNTQSRKNDILDLIDPL